MTEHEDLVDELSTVEKMSTSDRLKAARKKRLMQLKKYQQYERQLEKENNKRTSAAPGGRKKTATSTKPARPQRTSRRVQFVSNVVLLEAAARNDVDEGIISTDCSYTVRDCAAEFNRRESLVMSEKIYAAAAWSSADMWKFWSRPILARLYMQKCII